MDGAPPPRPKRVSHSLLDPLFFPLIPPLYRALRIPRRFPPEGIIAIGHLWAIAGAVGLALSLRHWAWALLAAVGPMMSHACDMVDGTHARTTGQCRNGGELLDHFVDPLAFAYWAIGISVSCGALPWGIAGITIIYATALLTSIQAKITGEFTLARFGSTETRVLLFFYGVTQAILASAPLALWFLRVMVAAGIVMLVTMLIGAVKRVNASGPEPDTTPWHLER